jgi:phosphate transport system permease protein
MTDITPDQIAASAPVRRIDFTSPAAAAALRRRYRAESRFQAYGLIALAVATAFLVALLVDIVRKAMPAFTSYSVALDVAVPANLVAPDKRGDAIAIRTADYFPSLRDALKSTVQGVEGRNAERTLFRLLSGGASSRLADMLVADPGLIGKTVPSVPLLLSANADLYFKGFGTDISAKPGRGIATPSDTKGEITVLSATNDFADDLVRVKALLRERVRLTAIEADRLERGGSPMALARAKEYREENAKIKARYDAPGVEEVLDALMPSVLLHINGGVVKVERLNNSGVVGQVLLPLSSTEAAPAGQWQVVTYLTPESRRKVTDTEVTYLERLRSLGKVHGGFNWAFFSSGDSREPELAGIRGAVTGTALTLIVTLLLSLPFGVMAAIYLEEFAPKNRLTDLIEVNINNLAAVPSIVFGLLGLAVFLNIAGFPRSAPLVGGMVLALMSLPTIIIATRAAIRAVPPSIKEAALGVGASHQQAVFHHVLPLAMPGIMTGTIIAMAQALGETAPLLMIGMVAFIVDVPKTFVDAATVLPVQIYLWSDLPELSFQYKTAAAIVVLLVFLFVMNGTAIWLRKRFERRW